MISSRTIKKITGKQWSDSSKTLFALILNYGGLALAKKGRETIGGPAMTTIYKSARLPYSIPQRLEQSSFARAREFFLRLGIRGPFTLAVDATPVVPSLKIRRNKVYGITQEDDVFVWTAQDIITIVEDESRSKAKLVNAFVLAPVYLSEPFYILALSPVKNGENWERVSYWFNQAVQMGLDNDISIIGIAADGDSKFRQFYLDKYAADSLLENGLTLNYDGFDFAAETQRIGLNVTLTTVMQPDWRHLIKKWRNQLLNTKNTILMKIRKWPLPPLLRKMLFCETIQRPYQTCTAPSTTHQIQPQKMILVVTMKTI